MKLNRRSFLYLMGLMGLTGLAGCSGSDSSSSMASGTAQAGGEDTQVLNIRATSFGNNYDVQDMGWRWMMAACYAGLYRNVADETGEHFVLDGAESVDISEDGTVYTFHLRRCWRAPARWMTSWP